MTAYPLTVEMDRSTSMRDIEMWSLAGAAIAAAAIGIRRPSGRLWLALAATPVAYRAITGAWPEPLARFIERPSDTRAALGGSRGIHVNEAIRLEKPVDEVYTFWRRLENLPRFMDHLDQVTEYSDLRSKWVARGPAGVEVAWEAEIINDIPHKLIAWKSLPGSDVTTAGSVNFDSVRAGRSTQVTVHLQYDPPAGRLGAVVARLFGREPSQTIREDLRRLKQLLEAGETPVASAEDQRSAR